MKNFESYPPSQRSFAVAFITPKQKSAIHLLPKCNSIKANGKRCIFPKDAAFFFDLQFFIAMLISFIFNPCRFCFVCNFFLGAGGGALRVAAYQYFYCNCFLNFLQDQKQKNETKVKFCNCAANALD